MSIDCKGLLKILFSEIDQRVRMHIQEERRKQEAD